MKISKLSVVFSLFFFNVYKPRSEERSRELGTPGPFFFLSSREKNKLTYQLRELFNKKCVQKIHFLHVISILFIDSNIQRNTKFFLSLGFY
jgi:hypothetical protein